MLPHHHLYAAAWGAAGLVWVLCGARLLHRRSAGAARPGALLALLVGAVLAAFAGARLHFLLLSSDLLREGGLAVLLGGLGDDGAGLRITGGLLSGAAVVLALGPAATGGRLGRAAIADVVVPLAGIAIALGRLGCFADGCCFGVPCDDAWCLRFPASSPAYWSHVAQGLLAAGARGPSLPVHPLQLYLAGAGLLAFVASALPRRAPDGCRALLFVGALAALRTTIEPLRESGFGIGVPHERAVGVALATVALVLLGWRVWTGAQRRTDGVISGS